MLEFLATIRLWLETTLHWSAPWALITGLIFLSVYGSRKLVPALWRWFDTVTPDGKLGHLVQALPSVALGALSGMLATGNVTEFRGAIAGAVAPIVHLVLKWAPFVPYAGAVRGIAAKAGLVAIVLLLASCTPAQRAAARTAMDAARILCFGAHAEQLGISPEQVKDALCSTEEQVRPWLEPALGAQRAGAVSAGMAK